MIEHQQTVVLVVDIQEKLFPADAGVRERFLANATKLIQAAVLLNVPVVATVQNPEKLGDTYAGIVRVLGGTPVLPKMEFSALANLAVQGALASTGRKQLLLVGMESHVCVLQSALDAVEQGYTPYVVRDAVASRMKDQHKAAISRMQRHGVGMVTAEMVIFEWLRIAGTADFRRVLPLLR